jgi:hypothetical protein
MLLGQTCFFFLMYLGQTMDTVRTIWGFFFEICPYVLAHFQDNQWTLLGQKKKKKISIVI